MADEPFVMLSLKGDKTKKLANALTNKSADKILAYLATKKTATESEIAKALKLPVSTVNYTMKVLVDAKLVVADEYHYSEKGREVNHYKLAKKYIIIAPDDEQDGFFQRMKKYLPAFGLTIGAAAVVRLLQGFFTPQTADTMLTAPMAAAPAAAPLHADIAAKTGEIGIESAPEEVLQEVYGDFARNAEAAPATIQDLANKTYEELGGTASTGMEYITIDGKTYTSEEYELMQDAARETTEHAVEAIQAIPEPATLLQNAPIDWFLWFCVGAISVFVLILLAEYVRKR